MGDVPLFLKCVVFFMQRIDRVVDDPAATTTLFPGPIIEIAENGYVANRPGTVIDQGKLGLGHQPGLMQVETVITEHQMLALGFDPSSRFDPGIEQTDNIGRFGKPFEPVTTSQEDTHTEGYSGYLLEPTKPSSLLMVPRFHGTLRRKICYLLSYLPDGKVIFQSFRTVPAVGGPTFLWAFVLQSFTLTEEVLSWLSDATHARAIVSAHPDDIVLVRATSKKTGEG